LKIAIIKISLFNILKITCNSNNIKNIEKVKVFIKIKKDSSYHQYY